MIHSRATLRRNAIRGTLKACSRRSEAVFLEPLAALGQVSARYIHQDSEGFFLFSSDLAGNSTDQGTSGVSPVRNLCICRCTGPVPPEFVRPWW